MSPSSPSSLALESLTASQVSFLQSQPKAELHAHLNGSIPLPTLQHLASTYTDSDSDPNSNIDISHTVAKLSNGVNLDQISDFFTLFPAIYALTSTPSSLRYATHSVLSSFLAPAPSESSPAQCTYIELRTTPRTSPHLTYRQYLQTILDEVESYPPDKAALIVSIDRRMSTLVAGQCVTLAGQLKKEGRRVVGVDLCGDPTVGNVSTFMPVFQAAREAGLHVTVHIAETIHNIAVETTLLLSTAFSPSRLGHATFLNDTAKAHVLSNRLPLEICLSSNLLCKTVQKLEDHHIRYWLERDHPIVICTDDTLPFRTTLLAEYALLLAAPPLGLGLSEEEVKKVCKMSLEAAFR